MEYNNQSAETKIYFFVNSNVFLSSDYEQYCTLCKQYGEANVILVLPSTEKFDKLKAMIEKIYKIPAIIATNNIYALADLVDTGIVVIATGDTINTVNVLEYDPELYSDNIAFVELDNSNPVFTCNEGSCKTIYVKKLKNNSKEKIVAESKLKSIFIKNMDIQEKIKNISNVYPQFSKILGQDRKVIFEAISELFGAKKQNFNGSLSIVVNKLLQADPELLGESLKDPYEVPTFKFKDLKDLISDLGAGKIVNLYEKLGGLKLKVSFKDGNAIFARNNTHMKDSGKHALSLSKMKDMFYGHGEVQATLYDAATDLDKMFKASKHVSEVFEDGKYWASLAVIAPKVAKVASYGQNIISVNTIYSFIDGKKDSKPELVAKLMEALRMGSGVNGDRFNIRATDENKLKIDMEKLKDTDFGFEINLLNTYIKDNGLTDDSTVSDMMTDVFLNEISAVEKITHYTIPNSAKDLLIKRLAMMDADTRLPGILDQIESNMAKEKIKELDSISDSIHKHHMAAIDLIFLRVGAKFISCLTGFLAEDVTDEILANIRSKIKSLSVEITNSKGSDSLSDELERLDAVTKAAKIYPTEGVVFVYRGAKIKLVGAFSPINKILSME